MPEYVDVTLFEPLRASENAEVSIQVDGRSVPMRVIKNEEDDSGWETTWRVQLNS